MPIRNNDRVIDPSRIGHGRIEQGTVVDLEGTRATVRWDGGAETVQDLSTLRPTAYPTSITPGTPGYVGYPKNDEYQFQEFAFAVIELGGYSDMSIVDPMTGARFWAGEILSDGPTWYEAMHRLASAAEQVGFFERIGDPQGFREEARIGRAPTEKENRRAEMRKRHAEERDALMRRHVEERNAIFGGYSEAADGGEPPLGL
jgi:hypothetical protein